MHRLYRDMHRVMHRIIHKCHVGIMKEAHRAKAVHARVPSERNGGNNVND